MSDTETSPHPLSTSLFSTAVLQFFRFIAVTKKTWRASIVLFIAYVVTGAISIYVNGTFDIAPALVWAPAGVALAGMRLAGYSMTPAIFFAALTTGLLNDYSVATLVGVVIGNTLQAIFGAYLLQRFDFNPVLQQAKDVYALLIVTVLASLTLPSVALSVSWVLGSFSLSDFSTVWSRVWIGNMLSILVLTPFITSWVIKHKIESQPFEIAERVAAFLLLGSIVYGLFWTTTGQFIGIPLAYFLLIPLFWIALRFSPRWMTLAVVCMTFAGLAGTLWLLKTGEIVTQLGARLFEIEMFMLVFGAMFFTLASIVQERRSATKALQIHVSQLQQALQRIQTEDDAKSEFLAILAHELRNPLALILSTFEFLKLRIPSEVEEASMLANAEDRVHTMARMLDDLLDMSRVSQRTFELQRQPTDVTHTISAALRSVALIIQNRRHNLSVILPKGPLQLLVDPVRFEQIIINLLTNAAKYTPEGGEISLYAEVEGKTLVIRVQDNGIGIPQHLIGRIFEPFQQVSEKRLRTEGLGIGLSITKRLVEMHGGSIEAHSKGVGKGSEFIVRLPLLATTEKPSTSTPEQTQRSLKPPGAFNILIVDDNEAAADSMARLLQHKGHAVQVKYSGKDAITAITEQVPEITILDIGLPDLDGYEVANYIRTETNTPTVLVALTGYGQESDKQRARDAGFDFHLTKPVSVADIEQILAVLKHS